MLKMEIILFTEKHIPRDQMPEDRASEADQKDIGAAAHITKTSAPFSAKFFLLLFFSDCTVSANGLKNSKVNGI